MLDSRHFSSYVLRVTLLTSQLLRYIQNSNPQTTPARLAFFNFLSHTVEPDSKLSPETIRRFFEYCLDFSHWVTNKSPLGHEVKFLLEHFNKSYQNAFDLKALRFPDSMQVIEIDLFHDALELIDTYIQSICGPKDKARILSDQGKRVVAIILKEDKSLEVRTFDKKFTVRNGVLEPLRTDLCLFYTPDLELATDKLHIIEVAPYITAQFRFDGVGITGFLMRGFVFQKLAQYKGESLKSESRILFPIKRLEQFFIEKKSDPYYSELVDQLEKACGMISQGDEKNFHWCSMVLSQAETALENVFLGDKLMTVLVKSLKTNIEQMRKSCQQITPIKEFD